MSHEQFFFYFIKFAEWCIIDTYALVENGKQNNIFNTGKSEDKIKINVRILLVILSYIF